MDEGNRKNNVRTTEAKAILKKLSKYFDKELIPVYSQLKGLHELDKLRAETAEAYEKISELASLLKDRDKTISDLRKQLKEKRPPSKITSFEAVPT